MILGRHGEEVLIFSVTTKLVVAAPGVQQAWWE